MPLALLQDRFAANVRALAGRYPALADALRALAPAREYHIAALADRVQLGVSGAAAIEPLPHPILPAAARDIVQKLFPGGVYQQPVLVAGEDFGWLWNSLYGLPCQSPAAPGHRPPLFFLARDVERLWVMLHVQDWQGLLADARVRLYAGEDAAEQFRRSLVEDVACPWPRLAVTVDPGVWPAGTTFDAMLAAARAMLTERLGGIIDESRVTYGDATAEAFAARYRSGEPLSVLGITSRYTTFLQHSMRDWLAAFERLGHRTRLVIEAHDHETPNNLIYATACAEFKPDLVVVIDHYRREFGGLPDAVPVAMWVQDALPNLFTPAAGSAQGERDFALGFARLKMVHEFGYPAGRYLSAVVGVNDDRFVPRPVSASEQAEFGCDVSFVSHASTPAEEIVQTEIKRIGSPEGDRLLSAVFEQLRAVYADGGIVTEPPAIRRMIDAALRDTRTAAPGDQMRALVDLFTLRVNNALFRHQSLHWAAAAGVNLHLYGRGWENHPALRRFARGPADNASQLATIYRASKINLQVTPHGAVHQRLLDGLAAGGFFLIRHCPGDVMEREFQAIWRWCQAHGVRTDADLRARADADIAARLAAVAEQLRADPFAGEYPFVEALRSSEECGYMRSAGTVWGADYDAVVYHSADEMRAKMLRYLGDDGERARVAESMRRPVLDRFTYTATCRRLLRFMADGLARENRAKLAA